jgi:sugar lactone lactonase YvrE
MGKQSLSPSRHKHAPLRIVLSLLLLFVCCFVASAQIASGPALSVPLLLPSAIVFDAAGNLYFAETANHVIRLLDTTGGLSSVAGTGTQGLSGDGGSGPAAMLDSPQGLALDATNNLYIADTHNHRIRRLSLTTGIITTIAGSAAGFSGDNGLAITAQLDLPTALALDHSSNLYIADTGNHRIRRVNLSTGIITTVAGTGIQGSSGDNALATAAAIDSPTGLAVDAANNLYLADTHNHRICRLNLTTGIITTIAGTGIAGFSGNDAPAITAALALPQGLTIDAAGNLYLADAANHRIRRIDATTGVITTVAGTGIQGFSGDSGLAIAASLDTPRATALSPSGLVTLADTANQRIRQLEAQPSPSTDIQTIAGLGRSIAAPLTLSAPAVIVYGTGQITASFVASSTATGPVTFVNISGATMATLGTAPLVADVATLSTAGMPAGNYTLSAIYAGDQTHLSEHSSPFSLQIVPQPLTATVMPTTAVYGQPIPTLNGSIAGVLPQDAGNVFATFATTAASISPVGSYPIVALLTGAAAGNYSVTPVTLTITPASTVITLSNLIATATSGVSTTLTVHVASTTSGTPTGIITLLDSAVPILTTALSNTGDAVFSTSSLAQGMHNFTAVYNGSTNFTASVSAPQQVTIGPGTPTLPSDFTLAATGSSTQTILSGSAANFTFAVQPQGALASEITLAASGLPNLATASFNPGYIPPGSPANTFTLTITTPQTIASTRGRSPIGWALLLCPVACLAFRPRTRGFVRRLVVLAIVTLPMIFATGCGDRVNSSGSSGTAAATKTYTITVTGTATTATGSILHHAATVTLILQPAA